MEKSKHFGQLNIYTYGRINRNLAYSIEEMEVLG